MVPVRAVRSLYYLHCAEPLSASIRSGSDIQGMSVRGREFKLSLFADDIILTLTHPRVSLPNLLSYIVT